MSGLPHLHTSLLLQIWVYGNSFEYCLVAIVVPREHALRDAAAAAGVANAAEVPYKVCASHKTMPSCSHTPMPFSAHIYPCANAHMRSCPYAS